MKFPADRDVKTGQCRGTWEAFVSRGASHRGKCGNCKSASDEEVSEEHPTELLVLDTTDVYIYIWIQRPSARGA